jgi:hypothetical protein
MAEFKLGRIKFVWKGPWSASTIYYKDDVVSAGGISYNCITAHTSAATFALDAVNWQQMSSGQNYVTAGWNPSTFFNLGDLVTLNGNVYYCVVAHTSSSTWISDISNWTLYSPGVKFRASWTQSTQYYLNDLVQFGADIYICTTANLSSSAFSADVANWTLFIQGLEFQSNWNSSTTYAIGDEVTYGGYVYAAKTINTNQTPSTSPASWSVVTTGYSNQGIWSPTGSYKIGSVVQFGGWTYVAASDSTGQQPYIGISGVNSAYWTLLVKGYNNRGNYAGLFSTGTSNGTATGGTATIYFSTAQTAAPFQIGNNIVVTGVAPTNFNGTFVVTACTTTYVQYALSGSYTQTATGSVYAIYYPGDVVVSAGSTYAAISVTSQSLPPNATNWTLISQSGLSVALPTSGDIPYNSSGAVTALHMNSGTQAGGQVVDGYVLKARTQVSDGSLQPRWGELGYNAGIWYVSPSGTDAAGYGRTLDKPFATIAYACANVTGPATIYVKTGTYSERLPITIKSNVTVIGDALRSVVVTPAAGTSLDGVTPNNRSRMFQMADGSQLVNMTLQGLTGQLTSTPYISGDQLNSTGILRLTAGTWPSTTASGAYIALDPSGTVVNKSPYVWNLTFIGTNAVGIYANGADQISGNKSILVSECTSIIDGGIHIWAQNQARVEALSSHSYYNYISICAQTGSVVRNQNGCTYYGTFGFVSCDLDPTDTGITGTVSQLSLTSGNTITVNGLSNVPRPGNVLSITGYASKLVVASVTSYSNNTAVIVTQQSFSAMPVNAPVVAYSKTSHIKAVGHDFQAVGTGGVSATNWPNVNFYNIQPTFQVVTQNYGQAFYESLDQDGFLSSNGLIVSNSATGTVTITGLTTAGFTPGGQPLVPTAGMLAVSNGTTWNPLSDGLQHLLVYLNGAWQKIA